jgi:hypothetical protein
MNAELANFLFDYKDGKLTWKNPSNPKRTPIGSIAGTVSKRGYIHIQYMKKIYKAHRLVYLMFRNDTPTLIDHINGVLTDNRIENLRSASYVENQRNSSKRIDNSSGIKNVSWHKRIAKWSVQLSVEKRIKHFGYFDDFELADLVATEARNKYHKEFANHGV